MSNDSTPRGTIVNFLVQNLLKEETDKEILKRRSFSINVRLLIANPMYKTVIRMIVEYMEKVMKIEFNDYSPLKGLSGANIGIPFNIISVLDDNKIRTFINPKIIRKSTRTIIVHSNCGSIRLKERIPVERAVWIDLEWHTIEGERLTSRFMNALGNTIQHEVEHNLGILITDKKLSGDHNA